MLHTKIDKAESMIFSLSVLISVMIFLSTSEKVYGPHEVVPLKVDGPSSKQSPGKFIGYSENVEVKGIVVANEDGNLYVMPDKNYLNLLVPGNLIAPKPGEKGYDWYAYNILGNRRAAGISTTVQTVPIIKMEMYPLCKNVACTEKYADAGGAKEQIPIFRDENGVPIIDTTILTPDSPCKAISNEIKALETQISTVQAQLSRATTGEKPALVLEIEELNAELKQAKDNYNSCINSGLNKGGIRMVKPGDHIRVLGAYVIDNTHPMYYASPSCAGSFASMRGLYMICVNHAELHPYNPESIRIVKPLQPGNTNVESHVVVAPIYTAWYSLTHGLTHAAGLSSHFVDDTKKQSMTSEFFIEAPPKPAECTGASIPCELVLQESDITKKGPVSASATKQANGYRIRATAYGTDIANPSVYKATWSVGWVAKTSTQPPPDTQAPPVSTNPCQAIEKEIAGLELEKSRLQAELRTASTGERSAIVAQINEKNSEIQAKKAELDKCRIGIPPVSTQPPPATTQPPPATTQPPPATTNPCQAIEKEIASLELEKSRLQAELRTASTGEKPPLVAQINGINGDIQAKIAELDKCRLG